MDESPKENAGSFLYLNMEFRIHKKGREEIAELTGDFIQIETAEEAVDLLGNASFQGARKVIIQSIHVHPDFFELRSGLAGDILQKFSNYRMKLAIVGSFQNIESKSLRDFIFESNKLGNIYFAESLEDALDKI